MKPYRVLLHKSLKEKFESFLKKHPEKRDALSQTCRKLCSNPEVLNLRLKGFTQPELVGRVFKIYVGGKSGHRLFYFVPESTERIVIPLFFSKEARNRFDYSKLDFSRIGEDILKDFREKNYELFTWWKPD